MLQGGVKEGGKGGSPNHTRASKIGCRPPSFAPPRPRRYYQFISKGTRQGRQFPRRHPMKLAYFDCFSGISGDMTLGALVDAGCQLEQLRSELRGLQVAGWELSAEKVWKNGMAATCVKVKTEDQSKHRSVSTILEILQKSQLAPQVRERAAAIFTKLGEAEARVHDVPLEKIHFHEVGAVDAIVDIVGACIGFHALGIEKFACSALNVGGGTAKLAHGILPLPPPPTPTFPQHN